MIVNGLICEGPKCKKGPNGERVSITWSADQVREHPETMPDAFFRFGSWQPNYEEPKEGRQEQPRIYQFCSVSCTRDFLANVVPPLSPREQSEVQANNEKVEKEKAEKFAKKNPLTIKKLDNAPIVADSYANAEAVTVVPN